MKRHFAILFIVIFSSFAVVAEDVGRVLPLLSNSSTTVQEVFKAISDDPQEAAVLGAPLGLSYDDTTIAETLLICWLTGKADYSVELFWWKSKSPLVRALAASLLLTGRDENTSNVPFLDTSRFSDSERLMREKELNWVYDQRVPIGKALKQLIEVTYQTNPGEWKESLRLRFSGF